MRSGVRDPWKWQMIPNGHAHFSGKNLQILPSILKRSVSPEGLTPLVLGSPRQKREAGWRPRVSWNRGWAVSAFPPSSLQHRGGSLGDGVRITSLSLSSLVTLGEFLISE